LARAQLRQQALAAQLASQKLSLATQWGARDIDFGHVDGALFHFVDVADFNELYRRAVASPALRVFADEARVRQAEIDLAMSRSRADIQWRAGVRHFAGADQSALVAGISIPLASAKRSRGDIQAATAERQLVDNRREIALLSLRSTLFDAWQTRQQAAHQVAQLNQRVLPILARALEQTRQAYERGRYSYVEWANIQQDFLDAKLALVDAATDTLMQQALIEQLTAEPLAAHSPPESNQD